MVEIGKGLWVVVVSLVLGALGCASSAEPYRVRYADIGSGAMKDFRGTVPLVVEFQQGDRLPVNFSFTGEDFELEPAKPKLELVAKGHCFVRFDEDGIRVSLDGEHFDQKPRVPGSFRVGFNAQRGKPTKLDVVIVAPQR